jgi:protein involved in polysaccharide export with SLBB domain
MMPYGPLGGLKVSRFWPVGLAGIFLAAVLLLAGCGRGRPPEPPAFTSNNSGLETIVPEVDVYRLLVDDEVRVTVLGAPEFNSTLRVLPDGTMSLPGVGSMYVLGRTLEEVGGEVNESLKSLVRYPQATLSVTKLGDRRVFVMGEVEGPGDHAYRRGMTVLTAIAQAGGFNNNAKRSSVIVLRRLGAEEAVAFRVDLRDPLKGENLHQDLPIRPFDIVYVPKTFIASLNVLVDQYFRNMTAPFTFYIEGWEMFHLDETRVRFVP